MKFLKYITLGLAISLISCGGSEREVIMDSGKVYTVKGNKFYNNGTDMTESMSIEDKNAVKTKLNELEDAEKALEKQEKKLKDAQDDIERKQKELKDKQDAMEKRQREIEDARKDFLKAKERLNDKEEKFKKLKEEGKLSPNDIADYETEIENLKQKMADAKSKMDKVNKN